MHQISNAGVSLIPIKGLWILRIAFIPVGSLSVLCHEELLFEDEEYFTTI